MNAAWRDLSTVCVRARRRRPKAQVTERRRAVMLARHFREAEGLSIAQIDERLSRSPVTAKAHP